LKLLTPLIKAVIYRLSYQLLFFVVNLILAAVAGPELFGIISLMMVNAAAFVIITDFGTGASLVWHGAGKEIQRERILYFAAGSGLLQLVFFMLAEFLFAKITGRTFLLRQPVDAIYFSAEVLYFVGLIIIEKYTSLLYASNKAVVANKTLATITGCFLIVFVLIYLKIVSGINALVLYCSMMFVSGVIQAFTFHAAAGMGFMKPVSDEFKSLLSFSALVFITNIIQFFAYRLDFWLVDYFYAHKELGIYAQANRFAQLIWVVPTILASLLAPALRNKDEPLNDRAFLVVTRSLNLITIFILVFVVVVAWGCYYWFFPAAYLQGLPALLIMLPGYFFFTTTTLLAAWFSARRYLTVNLVGSSICLLLILVADLTLIPIYSIRGAALANTFAYSLTTLYFLLQFNRHASVNIRDVFLWRARDIFAFKKLFRQ
jgi:O-antigen/teichoic acid export membrane protein